jgi:hypothetical protein
MFFILLSSSSYGLGIAPAKTMLEFSPDTAIEGKMRIITDTLPLRVALSKEGEIGRYVDLEEEFLILTEHETWVYFRINLPEELSPGDRTGGILITEQPESQSEENTVYAVTAIKHQIVVKVPYPGKYIFGKLYISSSEPSDPIAITSAIGNYGKEKIEKLNAIVVIKDPDDQILATLSSETSSLDPGKETSLIVLWNTNSPGSYSAKSTVEYDNGTIMIFNQFDVGDDPIIIESISAEGFKLGQVAKFDISIKNNWNQKIKAEADLKIMKLSKEVASLSSSPVFTEPRQYAMIESYWDTKGIDAGEYELNIIVRHDGKKEEKKYIMSVSSNKIQFKDQVSGEFIVKKEYTNLIILRIGVLLLITINIGLLLYILKKKKRFMF